LRIELKFQVMLGQDSLHSHISYKKLLAASGILILEISAHGWVEDQPQQGTA